MTKRAKEGDIYRVPLDKKYSKYLQYVMLDPAEMNSEVIRVFKYKDRLDETPNLSKVLESEIDFFAHVVVKWGIDLKMWERVGNIPIEKDFKPPYFRDVKITENDIVNGKVQYRETDAWQAWKAGDQFEARKPIGKLTEETKAFFLGGVIPPIEIIERMKSGSYSWPYFT